MSGESKTTTAGIAADGQTNGADLGLFAAPRQDALASLVVFLVALPLCMGIAIASGVPVAAGLITGIVGGLIVGALAGCSLQVSGPAAGLTVIVYEIVQRFGFEMHVELRRLDYIDHACLDLLMNWAKQHESSGGKLVIDWESLHAKFSSANGQKNADSSQDSENGPVTAAAVAVAQRDH